jgi:4-diphosphocytidyl-2-C-methyl-D-erythritol kinase
MTVRMLAYAKLNLWLEVRGLREDGFHTIRSIVQTIDLADRIEIDTGMDVRVTCSVPLQGPNLAEHAIRALLAQKGSQAGVTVHIEKNIPIGAGLGGGSSDAAAVLFTVNRLFPPVLPESEVSNIAGGLGSDVALFLGGGCMMLGGVGQPEGKQPTRREAYVVLVPDIACSTGEIYRAWRGESAPPSEVELGRNDLYRPAVKLHPELARYRRAMSELGGLYSGMTGSGSGFFAAFRSRREAISACELVTRQEPSCRVYCCQPTKVGFAEERGDEA